ncbi:Gp49 family protein [Denitromonas halophila]|uniref:Phage protein n=1 Tax=Denitromonas halophila TaxID=1629404 RepID=A0A557QX99_9RHOO|nr:Gp49 family protein [Denitromonas halophila]TVO57542.1 hypothetical protein FHP91_07650 [Denitromonas halophila]
MTDPKIENEIQAKGLTAPRITPADIEANIASEHYFTAYGGAKYGCVIRDEPANSEALKLLTFCVLVLCNGFTVTGESACVSPENFDAALGRKIARQNAFAKIWPLMGYALRDRLASPLFAIDTASAGVSVVQESEAKLAAIVREFVEKQRVSCPEATCDDRVYEEAPGLVEALCNVVGYYRYPDDEEV